MKAQRYCSLGLAVLSAALTFFSGGNVVATSSSSASSTQCTDSSTSDGDCDLSNNTEECGYDGGDCCECTCVDTPEYVCGVRAGFACLDPSASCFLDGGDDDANSTVEGDDFSERTPTPTSTTTSTEEPSSTTSPEQEPPSSAPPEAPTSNKSSCIPGSLADGSCDSENNSEECEYDGGDCCECTCISTTEHECGGGTGFACADPNASSSCVIDDGKVNPSDDDAVILLPSSDVTALTSAPTSAATSTSAEATPTAAPAGGNSTLSSSCISASLSDGSCDVDNNNEGCGFDGGDCCECTCVSTSDFACGDSSGYDCVDPNSSCEDLSVEGGSSAHGTTLTPLSAHLQLAMCTVVVLSLRRLS